MYHEDTLSQSKTRENEVRNDFYAYFTATLKMNLLELEVNLFSFSILFIKYDTLSGNTNRNLSCVDCFLLRHLSQKCSHKARTTKKSTKKTLI